MAFSLFNAWLVLCVWALRANRLLCFLIFRCPEYSPMRFCPYCLLPLRLHHWLLGW